ncbi:MAG: glycosyltransferase family 39 protein [Aquabacterium sp.]
MVSPVRWLWMVALASLACRAWLSAALPMTGDEATFFGWARFLDYGYYDHPPMVGWWIAGMRALLGDAPWAIRLPAVLLPLGVGAAMWWAWSPVDRSRAAWAVLLYWLAPINWLNALIVTDTPLILFAAWSTAAMVRAVHAQAQGRSAWGLYALAGIFIGLAFLSKYFAVMLGVAFAVYVLSAGRASWRGFVWMVLWALPAAALNVMWNLDHCWTNVMFNLFNRNEGAEGSWGTVGEYLLMLAYLLGPVMLWALWHQRQAVAAVARGHALLACVAGIPLLIFLLLSAKKVIGLHWVMAFYPFAFVMLALALPARAMRSTARGMAVWLGLHLLLVAAVASTDLQDWRKLKHYHRLVEALRTSQMVAQADAPGVVLASNVYSSAALFGYAAGRHVPVLGVGSVHARQDDLVMDYAALEGRTVRVLATRKPDVADYAPYFQTVRLLTFQQDGVPFYAVEGQGFRYEAYRQTVLAEVNRRYYQFPAWLPVRACVFCERYCGQARCAP